MVVLGATIILSGIRQNSRASLGRPKPIIILLTVKLLCVSRSLEFKLASTRAPSGFRRATDSLLMPSPHILNPTGNIDSLLAPLGFAEARLGSRFSPVLSFKSVMNTLREEPRYIGIHVTAIVPIMLIHRHALGTISSNSSFRSRHGDVQQAQFFFNLVGRSPHWSADSRLSPQRPLSRRIPHRDGARCSAPCAAFSSSESSNRAINSGGEEPTRASLCPPYPRTITIPRSTRTKP